MMKLTFEQMRKMWPRAPVTTAQAIARVSEEAFAKHGYTLPLHVAHLMAHLSHECMAGTVVRENMNYSAKRLMEVFGVGRHSAKITPEEAERLAGKPMAIAERVYGLGNPSKARELGNTRPGDGYRFRGNGMLQLTGGGSHRRVGAVTGFDLYENPEQLENPERSFRVAVAEFAALKCLPAARADDIARTTRLVNGGRNGLAERTVWLRRWKDCLGVDTPSKLPRAAPPAEVKPLMQSRIAQGGVAGVGLTSIVAVKETVDAVREVSDTAQGATEAVRPLLGLPLSILIALLAIAAVGACAFVIWKRYRKLEDEGV
jgi:putative chitinase